MTLEQFLSPEHKYPTNSWVEFPGFESLYVRKGRYYINGKFEETIQLANFEVINSGKGIFRRLINFLGKNYPEYAIVIECVHNVNLMKICEHMGFERINIESGCHFAKNCKK